MCGRSIEDMRGRTLRKCRLIRFFLLLILSGLLAGCQQEEEEARVYQLQFTAMEGSFLEDTELMPQVLSCDAGDETYFWRLTNAGDGNVLILGRLTADQKLEAVSHTPVEGFQLCGASAADDQLYVFLGKSGEVDLLRFDRDGTLIDQTPVEVYQEWFGQYFSYPEMVAVSREFFYLASWENTENRIIIWGCEAGAAEPVWKTAVEGTSLRYMTGYGDQLLVLYDCGGMDSEKTVMASVDQRGQVTAIWEGKENDRLFYTVTAGIREDRIWISDLNGLREISLTDGVQEEWLQWEDLNYIYRDCRYGLHETEEGAIVWIDYTDSQWQYVRVEETDASQVQEKTRVVLAGVDISDALKRDVSLYNLKQTEYQIEIVDYSQGGTIDFSDAVRKLYVDFATGEQIDLLYTSNLDVNWLAEKGYLEDLYDCMDAYGGIQRSDLDEDVRRVLEQDGHLYYLFPSFRLEALAVKGVDLPADQEAEGDWSLADCLREAADSGQEIVFHDVDQMNFLKALLSVNQDSWLVLRESGYQIQREALEELLQILSLIDTERKDTDGSGTGTEEIRVTELPVQDLWVLQAYREIWGEDMIFSGYPSDTGSGVLMVPGYDVLAISKTAAHQEAAWQYLSDWLTQEDDERIINVFPIFAESLDCTLAYQQTLQTSEETGEALPYMKRMVEEVWFTCYAATEVEEEIFRELLGHAVLYNALDDAVWEILEEELQPYLMGQKSLEETLDIVSNRIQIMLDERE